MQRLSTSFLFFSPVPLKKQKEEEYCAKEKHCTHCKQLRVAEQKFNQKFNAHDILDAIWANNLSAISKAYLYFFLDPRAAGKVLTVENVFDDFELFEKAICYAGESERDGRQYDHHHRFTTKLEKTNYLTERE